MLPGPAFSARFQPSETGLSQEEFERRTQASLKAHMARLAGYQRLNAEGRISSMAEPQLEDGFTRIANELLEAIYNAHLSEYESRIFLFILRMTYGFGHKSDTISISQFENGITAKDGGLIVRGTGIHHRHICATLNTLKGRNIIEKHTGGYIKEYSIQKDYTKWRDIPLKQIQSSTSSSTAQSSTAQPSMGGVLNEVRVVLSQVREIVLSQVNTKETKEIITKEMIPKKP